VDFFILPDFLAGACRKSPRFIAGIPNQQGTKQVALLVAPTKKPLSIKNLGFL
jgi:hypothetical protein